MSRPRAHRPRRFGFPLLALLVVWFVIAFLPLIALKWSIFTVEKADDLERIKGVLSQLGTYGDMFGVVNSLFSGAALLMAIHTLSIQTQELEEADKDRAREAARQGTLAYLQAISVLAQVNSYIYSQNPKFYDDEATDFQLSHSAEDFGETFPEKIDGLNSSPVKMKLDFYVGQLEAQLKEWLTQVEDTSSS
ncbi:hypothetical protein [Paludisphaera rhizosphaerae]|uniref:hypothetical protein n=1 Tax=Paludisphaera rhizosphaerae TaxID=2711216 RepID=UPI0013ED6DD8|nr:hypothetical protein [Paludisphaera rhizosphaerae]